MSVPPELRDKEKELTDSSRKKDEAIAVQDFESAARYRDQLEELQKEITGLKDTWREKKKTERLVVDETAFVMSSVNDRVSVFPIGDEKLRNDHLVMK
jgi:ATP-dependent Clp protease ATP-binding subunit ClpC